MQRRKYLFRRIKDALGVLNNSMGYKIKSTGFTIYVIRPFINNDYLRFRFFKGFFFEACDKCSDSAARIASCDVRRTAVSQLSILIASASSIDISKLLSFCFIGELCSGSSLSTSSALTLILYLPIR